MSDAYDRIYAVIRRIPDGQVATYGQIARLAGLGAHARMVGYALSALPERSDIPWHRVINARGEISKRSEPAHEPVQRALLEQEDIGFGPDARISLTRYQWQP